MLGRRLSELHAKDVNILDGRCRREQRRGVRHERLRDRSSEVSLSPRIICKRIEDREGGWPKSEREPHGGRRFLLSELETLHQKCSHLFRFIRFCFQAN